MEIENNKENNIQDEIVQEEIVQEETAAEETAQEEITREEIVQNEIVQEELVSEEEEIIPEETEETTPKGKKYIIKNKILRETVSWIITIVSAIFIAIIINTYFFRISKVSGDSMKQTYHDKDVVYITRLPYIFGDVDRNDIVIFDSTLKSRNFFTEIEESFKYNVISYKVFGVTPPTYYYIKRVVAVEGDIIQIKEDGVYVNGEHLDETYVNPDETPRYTNVSQALKDGIEVPEGKVFVMGDNRNHSTDSRAIGFVPVEDIIGKVIGT